MVNEWTRDDLPAVMDLVKASVDAVATDPSGGAYAALDAVVDHLNEHHPKPDAQADAEWLDRALNTPDEQLVALDEARIEANIQRNRAVRERDVFAHRLENQSETIAEMQGVIKGLHRAHEIVERERDQARESLRRLRGETDFDLFTVRDQLKQCRGEREQMTRERDEARADRDHYRDSLGATVTERDEWMARAEAAEARTAPAVTKADIEKAIRGKVWAANREPNKAGFHRVHVDWATDAVWSLVSGADPAVLVVRESDIAAVKVERDSHGEWFADGEHVYALGAADSRNLAGGYMQKAIRRLAVARATEQDAATDPITDAIRDGLNVWGTTDEGVRQIAESVRRAISNDGGENVL